MTAWVACFQAKFVKIAFEWRSIAILRNNARYTGYEISPCNGRCFVARGLIPVRARHIIFYDLPLDFNSTIYFSRIA